MKNLESLYGVIESWIDNSRSEYDRLVGNEKLLCDGLPLLFDSVNPDKGRACFPLGQGYLLKFRVAQNNVSTQGISFVNSYPLKWNHILEKFEETNVQLLREFGLSNENGFYIPEHKIVGIELVEGKAKVNPEGSGWTITEDISLGGEYSVTDIFPYHFSQLKNRTEFASSYIKHMRALMRFCRNPKIRVDRWSHPIENLPDSLSRFLLLKQKNRCGKIVIGDLDNLQFYRRESR